MTIWLCHKACLLHCFFFYGLITSLSSGVHIAGCNHVLAESQGFSPLHQGKLASAMQLPPQASGHLPLRMSSALSNDDTVSSVSPQAMFELVTSEASYYKSLNLLVSHFMENERLKKILHPSEAHILFSNVLDVMAVSER